MAYLPFEYLKEKLISTGLYEDKEDSAALLELQCYASGFQNLGDEIESILNESFAQTASETGLGKIEQTLDLGFISEDIEERRKGVIAASKIAAASFTERSLKEFLTDVAGECEYEASYTDFTLSVLIKNRGLTSYFTKWIQNILEKLVTAELILSVIVDGLIWLKIDSKNLTWLEMDTKNYTWEDIEKM